LPRFQFVCQNFPDQFLISFRTFFSFLRPFYFKFIISLLIACTLCLIPLITYAAQVTLAWDPPNAPVAGYNIYYGTTSGAYQYSADVGNYTSCNISGLNVGATYYFAVTAYDFENNESDFSDEFAYTIPIDNFGNTITLPSSGDTIPLPSAGAYGNIKGGDQSHIDEVNYSFGGLTGDVTLNYEAWDVDFTNEIEIVLNGTHIGYAPKTVNDSWGKMQTITLPDALVYDSSNNYLTFNNTSNPPSQWYWGVRNVSAGVP